MLSRRRAGVEMIAYLSPDVVSDFDCHDKVVCMNPYRATAADDDEEASVGDISDRPVDRLHEQRLEPLPFPIKSRDLVTETEEQDVQKHRSVIAAGVESVKYLSSFLLLLCAVFVTVTALFTRRTETSSESIGGSTHNLRSWAALILFLALLSFLAVMECGESCLTGLQAIPGEKYAASHPIAYKNANLTRGNRMNQFVMGRQFIAALIIFTVQHLASPVPNANVLGLSCSGATNIILGLNVAMILVVGQLTVRVHASACKLDFMNSYVMLITSYASLAVERSGVFHCVYLLEEFIAKIVGRASAAPTFCYFDRVRQGHVGSMAFWSRSFLSLLLLGLTLWHILGGIFRSFSNPEWQGENIASSVTLFIVLWLIFVIEGIPVALTAINKIPKAERDSVGTEVAWTNNDLAGGRSKEKADDFRFGRQICVTGCTFAIASISSSESCFGEYLISLGLWKQSIPILTILAGSIVVTVVSLTGRTLASSSPFAFLSTPFLRHLIGLCLALESSSIWSASFVLARYHILVAAFQPDDVYLEGREPGESQPISRKEKDIDRLVTVVKYSVSFVLLIASVVVISVALIWQNSSHSAQASSASMRLPSVNPVVHFFVFWFLLAWLAMMEGGQGCLISLGSINKAKYASSHPLTLKNVMVAQTGDNIERFIMGRQFLVFSIVFVINLMCMGASETSVSDVLGLPAIVDDLFLSKGMAMVFTTIIIGQLMAQVNAAVCMLDFINNYLMLLTTYVSLGIELSGILHSVYIVQIIFSKVTGQPIKTKESPRTILQNLFFWGRVMMSLVVLSASFMITVVALLQNKTLTFVGVPGPFLVVVFVGLMCFVGLFEGIQIALFAVIHMPEKAIAKSKVAKANCDLVFRNQNLQALLIGRQFCVTTCMFVVARMTMLNYNDGGETMFGVSQGFQDFLDSGLLGALITTIVASLAWRIVASSFPLAFLSNPLIYLIIRLCLVVEASGVCSVAWILARLHKRAVDYQPDEVYLEGAPRETSAPGNKRAKDVDITVTVMKYMCSTALLIFSVRHVVGVILSEQQTSSTRFSHPFAAFVFFWFLLAWMAVMEGGQGCLIALQCVEKKLYASSHPMACRCTTLAHKGDNMERFIVGRQFLVFVVVFMANLCLVLNATNDEENQSNVFFSSGAAIILTTIVLGQLTAQVTAANCMLDFINSHFMLFTTYVSLMIERTGILHASYLVQFVFSKVSRMPMKTNEPPRTFNQKIFFWGRVCVSVTFLVFSFVVTVSAIMLGKTTVWRGIPGAFAVFLFFGLMSFVGLMEGLQIALFEIINVPEEDFDNAKVARAIRDLAFCDQNLQAILIGRQICVTTCMFVVARITTMNFNEPEETIFGVSPGMQRFFNTGILGAFISTIVASLAWRIVASSFPLAFLSNPLIYVIMHVCLLVEKSGIGSASWLLALFHKALAGFRVDEVYLDSDNQELKFFSSKSEGNERNSPLDECLFPSGKLGEGETEATGPFIPNIKREKSTKSYSHGKSHLSFVDFGTPEDFHHDVDECSNLKKFAPYYATYHTSDTGGNEESAETTILDSRSQPVSIPIREETRKADTDLFDDDEEEIIEAQTKMFSQATRRMYHRIVQDRRKIEYDFMGRDRWEDGVLVGASPPLRVPASEEERRGLLLSVTDERTPWLRTDSMIVPERGPQFRLNENSLEEEGFFLRAASLGSSNISQSVQDDIHILENAPPISYQHTPEEQRKESAPFAETTSVRGLTTECGFYDATADVSSKLKPRFYRRPFGEFDLGDIQEEQTISQLTTGSTTSRNKSAEKNPNNRKIFSCEVEEFHPKRTDESSLLSHPNNNNHKEEISAPCVVVNPSTFIYETPPDCILHSPVNDTSQEEPPPLKQIDRASRNNTNFREANSSIITATDSLLNGGLRFEDKKILRLLGLTSSSYSLASSPSVSHDKDTEDGEFCFGRDHEEERRTLSGHSSISYSSVDMGVDIDF